jgi:acyl-CoA thioesterase
MVEPRPLDYVLLATFMDAWPPAVFPRVASPVVAPTIDLTIHFRTQLPPPGAGADDFYLGVFTSVAGIDGFFEEDGQMWTSDGSLIAQSRQLALMLPAKR